MKKLLLPLAATLVTLTLWAVYCAQQSWQKTITLSCRGRYDMLISGVSETYPNTPISISIKRTHTVRPFDLGDKDTVLVTWDNRKDLEENGITAIVSTNTGLRVYEDYGANSFSLTLDLVTGIADMMESHDRTTYFAYYGYCKEASPIGSTAQKK